MSIIMYMIDFQWFILVNFGASSIYVAVYLISVVIISLKYMFCIFIQTYTF